VFKRGFDICASAVLLLLALPALLLSALIIRITSPGPVLFRQERMGRDFQSFYILKLRTMAHAQTGLAYTLGPDPRITPFGKWLRRSKLDEVPQLWNVLRGEMSLVGPRPVIPELTEEFYVQYRLLLQVRPGLTDPASLKYSQEAQMLAAVPDAMHFFKTVVTPDKIRISLDYLKRANLWTDVVIMTMTGVVCFFPRMSEWYGLMPNACVGTITLRKAKAGLGKPARILTSNRVSASDGAYDGSLTGPGAQTASLAALRARERNNQSPTPEPWISSSIRLIRGDSTAATENGDASGL
jgi:lipopolysaccharide/colanic/teichoic acid biosynthesis glycosyltransferase